VDARAARKPRVSLPVACAIAFGLSVVAAVWFEKSALAISLIAFVLCALGAVRPGATARRVLCINLALLLAIFAAAEVVLSFEPLARSEGSHLDGYTIPDERLGYAPAKGHETTYRRFGGDVLVYDVVYSIDANGLRKAPPHRPEAHECILFFGDSFTFGEGLRNEETLPYRVGLETDGAYRIHNFGFHGYGPHQMLAALELGVVDEAIDCTPRFVFYQGAAFHIDRAAGLSSWEKGGPRFEPTDDGLVEHRGQWDPTRFEYPAWLTEVFGTSYVLGKIPAAHRPTNDEDYVRYLGILETSRRLVETRHPGAEFWIVYWDAPDDPIVADLVARGFRVLRVSEILTDRAEFPDKYRLHELDGHPNALAMSKIAARVAEVVGGSDPGTNPTDER
jgi:hypothetical protein